MSDIAFRYTGGPGITGIPARDITVEEFADMSPDMRRQVKHLAAYEPVETDAVDDPLLSLANEEYAALSPQEKAARTREAKKLTESDQTPPRSGEEGQ